MRSATRSLRSCASERAAQKQKSKHKQHRQGGFLPLTVLRIFDYVRSFSGFDKEKWSSDGDGVCAAPVDGLADGCLHTQIHEDLHDAAPASEGRPLQDGQIPTPPGLSLVSYSLNSCITKILL